MDERNTLKNQEKTLKMSLNTKNNSKDFIISALKILLLNQN